MRGDQEVTLPLRFVSQTATSPLTLYPEDKSALGFVQRNHRQKNDHPITGKAKIQCRASNTT